MNYEKLTVERFAARLKEGAYKGLTGARRAIGKTEWTKKDKDAAHELAEKHFGTGGKSAPKTAAKKAAKAPAKKAAAPKKAAGKAPKKAASAKPKVDVAEKPAAAPKRAPAVAAGAPVVPTAVPQGPSVLEEATRQNAASAVITAFRNSGPLNNLEQRAYDVANVEYVESMSRAARRVFAATQGGIPVPGPLPEAEPEEAAAPDEVVTAPAGVPPRIPVPNGADTSVLTPEQQAQYEKMQRGATALGIPQS